MPMWIDPLLGVRDCTGLVKDSVTYIDGLGRRFPVANCTSASPRMWAIETRVRFSSQNTFPEYYQTGNPCARVSDRRFAPARCANAPPLDGAPRVSW